MSEGESSSAQRAERIQKSLDSKATERSVWKKKNWYYYKKVTQYFKLIVPEGSSVLEIGSGDGDLLAALNPSRGLGIDASAVSVDLAKKNHPHLEFRHELAESFKLEPEEKFEYIVISDLLGYLDDVQAVLQNLHQVCLPSTRIVISCNNYLWEPILELGSNIGWRTAENVQNWLSLADLENLVHISGFETVREMRKLLLPGYVPILSAVVNRLFANLPFIRKFCLLQFVIARPLPEPQRGPSTVSVVVACRNEKGNIQELVERIPRFPPGSEVIFIDGNSTDGTAEEIQRLAGMYPEKSIKLFHQRGPMGKGAAVRIGFMKARGEILVILDADLSVAPEDISKFCALLTSRLGEFINGSRLVYPMREGAMRFLNTLGNKFFSMVFTFLLDERIKDTLCGTKALYRSDYKRIARNRSYFGNFDPFGDFDLLFGAAKLNMKIVELPVRYYERKYGATKIKRFWHGLLLLGMCTIAMRKIKFK